MADELQVTPTSTMSVYRNWVSRTLARVLTSCREQVQWVGKAHLADDPHCNTLRRRQRATTSGLWRFHIGWYMDYYNWLASIANFLQTWGSALYIKGTNFESCAPNSPAETMTAPILGGQEVTASPSPIGISSNGVTRNGFQRSSTSSTISEPESVRSTTSHATSIHTSFIPLSRTSSVSSTVSFASGEVEDVTEEGVRHAEAKLSAK